MDLSLLLQLMQCSQLHQLKGLQLFQFFEKIFDQHNNKAALKVFSCILVHVINDLIGFIL